MSSIFATATGNAIKRRGFTSNVTHNRELQAIMHSLLLRLSSITLILGLLSCAILHPYDEANPEAYKHHWENNEESKDNEVLYLFSEECKENKEKICL